MVVAGLGREGGCPEWNLQGPILTGVLRERRWNNIPSFG